MSSQSGARDLSRKKFLDDLNNKISILSIRDNDDDDLSMATSEPSTVTTERPSAVARDSARRSRFLSAGVVLLGAISASMFMAFGISSAQNSAKQDFHHLAEELALQVTATWDDYETASRWIHQACVYTNTSRQDFRHLYEYMDVGLDVMVSATPNLRYLTRVSRLNRLCSLYVAYY